MKIADPHSLDTDTILKALDARDQGLSVEEAAKRLSQYGPNQLPVGRSVSPFYLLLKQFKSWLVIILILAAIISWVAGQVVDTWVIIAVVIINASIGFSQEFRAEKAISALQELIVKTAKVLRAGKLITLPSEELVPGDIIILEEGDSIPADGRIIQNKNFRTLEASLTGESLPVSKMENPLPADTALADRKNMVWKSTFVAGGYARAIVTGTGAHTAIGDISRSLGEIEVKRTNFMRKTDVLARQMSVIAIASATGLFIVGFFFRNFEINEILLTSIAALVAAVPEGLPAIISIVLALGARRMAKKNAIIREFSVTETLGAVTAILTDKTGTLTQNSLTVRKVFVPGEPEYTLTGEGWFPAGNFLQDDTIIDTHESGSLQKLLKIAALSNNSTFRHDPDTNAYELIGDPTEGALSVLARKGGILPEPMQSRKVDDLPFDSAIKMRATLVREGELQELYVTGAPEKLLERSSSVLLPEGEQPLSPDLEEAIQQKISEWSNHAMRVIALAYKKHPATGIDKDAIDNLVFAGITGMIDPPRPDAKEAVEKCRQAGIRVIMVTGDHINTAVAIAKASGIIEEHPTSEIIALTEQQLQPLADDEFDEAIRNIPVFARLTPAMKLKIAGRLQAMGQLIAMTGDGVNDAPALKKADVGVSMGIMGTDVARDSSDVVLADDNFATIVNAIEEGRIVFTNSRQTSFFLVTTNLAESITLLSAIAMGLPIPLLATQILWLNLVTDSFPAIALANEKGHQDITATRSPGKSENILNKEVIPFLVINALIMAGLSLAVFYQFLDENLDKARTGVFMVMTVTQLFNVYNLRSLRQSVFAIGIFSNRSVNWAVVISGILLIAVTELSWLADILHFEALSVTEILVLFTLSSAVLWAGELYKLFKTKASS